MSSKSPTKKPSLLMRLFSTERKSSLIDCNASADDHTSGSLSDEKLRQRHKRLQRLHSMDAATFRDRSMVLDSLDAVGAGVKKRSSDGTSPTSPTVPDSTRRPSSAAGKSSQAQQRALLRKQSMPAALMKHTTGRARSPGDKCSPTSPTSPPAVSALLPLQLQPPTSPSGKFNGSLSPTEGKCVAAEEFDRGKRKSVTPTVSSPRSPIQSPLKPPVKDGGKKTKNLKHKKVKNLQTSTSSGVKVDASVPLEFPTTPETILEYHRQKPFLKSNEEWLVMELNEFECLVDSVEIIRIIAKHSKFFEVEPDELWEEFFEFVEDVPSYDEIINYDVWQEFRDQKYPC